MKPIYRWNVTLSLCLSWRHMGQWRNNYTHYSSRHQTEVKGSNSGPGSFIPGKDPPLSYWIAAGLVVPTTDPDASDYVTLLVITGRNQFLTWYIKHGRVSSPFSGVTKGRNYKPILRVSSQWSYQLTTKQSYALLQQLPGLLKCVNYSLQSAPTSISYTLLHSVCGLRMSFEFTRSNETTMQVTSS